MYSHYCKGCGKHFYSVSMNDNYCSANCASIAMNYKRQQAADQESFRSNRNSDAGSYHSGGAQPAIPIELIVIGTAGYFVWEVLKRWDEFEPVTRHILLIFHYIFYKPLYFSTSIHSYLTGVDQLNELGAWFFFVKWFAIIFYIMFVFSFYIVIIEALNKKGLMWLWISVLISPVITHGIWYFLIR
jgi:hypothetical protein